MTILTCQSTATQNYFPPTGTTNANVCMKVDNDITTKTALLQCLLVLIIYSCFLKKESGFQDQVLDI